VLGRASAAEVVLIAQQCLQAGAWDHALALCEASSQRHEPSVKLCHAVARFVGGDAEQALGEVEAVLEHEPEHLSATAIRAQILARSGRRDEAVARLLELTARYPDYPGAQGLLATLLLPGPHYRDVLAKIHERLRPRTYLEIGIESGATLTLAGRSQLVIGVDPAEYPIRHVLPQGTRLFHEESDTFFRRTRESVLGTRRVDLAFIDGMHRFENALADFANCEAWANADSTIVLHDCLPLVARTAARERSTKFWVGDTWKVVFALAKCRPELDIRTLLCAPSGLVVVRGLNPGSTTIREQFSALLSEFSDREWDATPGRVPSEFGAVTNDDAGLTTLFGNARP
jgi:hypothetical protein